MAEWAYEVTRHEGRTTVGTFSWAALVALAKSGDLKPDDQVLLEGNYISQAAENIEALWDDNSTALPPHLDTKDIAHPKQLAQIVHVGNVANYFRSAGLNYEPIPNMLGLQVQYRGQWLAVLIGMDQSSVGLAGHIPCGEGRAGEVRTIAGDVSARHPLVKAYFADGNLVLKVELLCRNMAHFRWLFKRAAPRFIRAARGAASALARLDAVPADHQQPDVHRLQELAALVDTMPGVVSSSVSDLKGRELDSEIFWEVRFTLDTASLGAWKTIWLLAREVNCFTGISSAVVVFKPKTMDPVPRPGAATLDWVIQNTGPFLEPWVLISQLTEWLSDKRFRS